jgi:membrane protease YdiL (CAAX protease family)
MNQTAGLMSRVERFTETFCICAGFVLLGMLWAGAMHPWLYSHRVPALPSSLAAAALLWAVHLRTPAQRERVRLRRLPLPAWAVALAIASFMALKTSVERLLTIVMPHRGGGGDPVEAWLASGGGWVPLVLAMVVLVPLAEETVFRGLLQTMLERRHGTNAAVLWGALIFALGHFNPWGFPSILLGGLVLSYAFRASRSLWLPLLLHAAANATMVLSTTGLSLSVRTAAVLLLPSAAVLVWLGFRFRPVDEGADAHAAAGPTDLALAP